jgi:hypothetical protein
MKFRSEKTTWGRHPSLVLPRVRQRRSKVIMANLSSSSWIELAVLQPGQSHYWFFDHPHDLHGWVFQATAHPECAHDESAAETRVEVSELFVLCNVAAIQGGKRSSQVNITVTNYSGRGLHIRCGSSQ